ncbi:MAG TPA: glycoside hydrolase family 43 protein [Saprospiraceae bacterium]|nr:glycoside hydrolase family 43 protein [Saprospiraceae bacterium]
MKNILLLFVLLTLCSCNQRDSTTSSELTEVPTTFQNPILAGFNPDPSICRVGDDYYLVNSSFGFFPGIPVLHSKNLVNWEQIGAVLDENQQLNLSEQRITRGFFAPAITYHDGWFYVVCTLIDEGGNFIVKSKNPEGPYSEPYWLPELNGGIDPSLFFDEDGKLYVIYNLGPPNGESLYSGHRTIRMRELDPESLQVIGEEILLVNGGVDITQEPVWIEAPHIYKINGYYYLMCAEGGTSYNHSEVVFRSRDIRGEYIPYEENPILTQRDLDPSRPKPITSAGHADMVQLPSGEWWAVFLACRPYEGGHYNTGRETFLAPVEWQDGWPVINPDFEEVQYEYPLPNTGAATNEAKSLQRGLSYEIDFTTALDQRWLFLRNVRESWYQQDQASGTLSIDLRPDVIAERGQPSLMLRRQPHLEGEVSTFLRFSPEEPEEMAGLIILQDETHYYFVNKAADRLQLLKQTENAYELLAEAGYTGEGVHLKVQTRGDQYHFWYSEEGDHYEPLLENVDATYLSSETAGSFVGCHYGLYASSNGAESSNQMVVEYFNVSSDE